MTTRSELGSKFPADSRIRNAPPPGESGRQHRAPPDEPVYTQLGTCRVGAKATNPLHWRVSCCFVDTS